MRKREMAQRRRADWERVATDHRSEGCVDTNSHHHPAQLSSSCHWSTCVADIREDITWWPLPFSVRASPLVGLPTGGVPYLWCSYLRGSLPVTRPHRNCCTNAFSPPGSKIVAMSMTCWCTSSTTTAMWSGRLGVLVMSRASRGVHTKFLIQMKYGKNSQQ